MTNSNDWNKEPRELQYGDDPSNPPPQEGFADWGSSNMYTGGPAVGSDSPQFTNQWDLTEPAAMLRNGAVQPRGVTPWVVIKWTITFGVVLFIIMTIVAMVLGFMEAMAQV